MPLTNAEINYLRNKHKGGVNNSKGNKYENYYTVFCIILLIDKCLKSLDNVLISSQLELCFVDDLSITLDTRHLIYHQIKDVNKISWNSKRVKIKDDFIRQMEISRERGEDFELKLVHSSIDESVNCLPEEIKDCTTTPYFPRAKSLNQLVLGYPPFKQAILNITHSGRAADDQLLGIAEVILGVWSSIEQTNVSLRKIVDETLKIGNGFINIKTYPDVCVSNDCAEILRRNNIDFYTQGIKLYWSVKGRYMQGNIEWTAERSKKIVESNPSDILALLDLLY